MNEDWLDWCYDRADVIILCGVLTFFFPFIMISVGIIAGLIYGCMKILSLFKYRHLREEERIIEEILDSSGFFLSIVIMLVIVFGLLCLFAPVPWLLIIIAFAIGFFILCLFAPNKEKTKMTMSEEELEELELRVLDSKIGVIWSCIESYREDDDFGPKCEQIVRLYEKIDKMRADHKKKIASMRKPQEQEKK